MSNQPIVVTQKRALTGAIIGYIALAEIARQAADPPVPESEDQG